RQSALAPRREPLADRARPDRRVEHTDYRLVLGIDGHRGVDEKTRRLAIAGRTQAVARPIAPAEIDLGRILNRDNPPPAAALTGAPPQRPNHLRRTHPRRIEKAVRRNLPRPIAANRPQDQRSGGHDPLKKPRPALRPADIPENPNTLGADHRCLLPLSSM